MLTVVSSEAPTKGLTVVECSCGLLVRPGSGYSRGAAVVLTDCRT